MRGVLRQLVVAGCFLGLAACGGGGGSGGSQPPSGGSPPNPNPPITPNPPSPPTLTYAGSTSPAATSRDVLPELSWWLLVELGIGDANSSPALTGTVGEKTARRIAHKQLNNARQRAPSIGAKATIQAVTDEACSGGGSVEQNDNGISANGTGTLVLTFHGCIEDGIRTDGVVRGLVSAYDLVNDEPTDLTITFESMRITDGAYTIDMGGTIRTVMNGASALTTYNTVSRYLPEDRYTRLEDFTVAQSPDPTRPPRVRQTLQGRFYLSSVGYVNITTLTQLVFATPDESAPLSGVMRLAGAPGARADLGFVDAHTVTLSLDDDADDIYDFALSASYDGLFDSQNFAPRADAGPDQTVLEGMSVTLDGQGSLDWEGAALTYQWTVTRTPGAGITLPDNTQRALTFVPTMPGAYTFQLQVSDGQLTAVDSTDLFVQDNMAPVANAGPDRVTTERSAVTLDANASSDLEHDALQFTWTRTAAPQGSAAAALLTGRQPTVTIDLPGTYQYALRVDDALGSSIDTVTITADKLLGVMSADSFIIHSNMVLGETRQTIALRVSPRYSGPPVPVSISSNVPWLTVDSVAATTASPGFTISLRLDELDTLPSGTNQAILTVAAAGDYTPTSINLSAFMHLPNVQNVAPYVAYTGASSRVTLFGQNLDQVAGRSLKIAGMEVQGFTNVSGNKAQIVLPALPAGEYTVSVTNALNVDRPMARVFVRNAPVYQNADVTLPGSVQSLEYDAERDVFYAVFSDGSGSTYLPRRLKRQPDGAWQADNIVVPNPQAVSLTADGRKLLFTTGSCGVYELDPDTLQTLHSEIKPGCYYEFFGMVHAMANTDILIADTDQWPTVYRYPGFEASYALLPSLHSPAHVLSYDRTRMLWAEQPTISPPNELYAFDVATQTATQIIPNDSGMYFLTSNLAISGDGSRIMHREDVYDSDLQFMGQLQGTAGPYLMPALSRYGALAAVLDHTDDTLSLFDVSLDSGFPKLRTLATFGEDVGIGTTMMFTPDDATVFAFTRILVDVNSSTWAYRLYVRSVGP